MINKKNEANRKKNKSMKKNDSNKDEIEKLTSSFTLRELNKIIEKKFMFLINYSHFIIQQSP